VEKKEKNTVANRKKAMLDYRKNYWNEALAGNNGAMGNCYFFDQEERAGTAPNRVEGKDESAN